jgi:hypothetical protein
LYAGPFVLSKSATVKSRAFRAGLNDSAVAAANFVFSISPNAPVVAFDKMDAVTQGNWKGVYGGDGGYVVGTRAVPPGYGSATPTGSSELTWARTTSDVRGLLKFGVSSRVAAAWSSSTSFTIDVNMTDGQSHQLALYCVDWERRGRAQTVELLDPANNAVLDSRSLSGFQEGRYLVWNVRGKVRLRITRTAGPNAVVSGLLFGVPPAQPPVSFVKSDSTTQGNWKGVYGTEAFQVVGDAQNYPAAIQVTPVGKADYTWADPTSDVRALLKAASTDRTASCWYGDGFTVDLNLIDGQAHRVSIYCLDWDRVGRSQIVDVIDPTTGTVLNSQTISSFQEGRYVTWDLRGHLQLRFRKVTGPNAVLMGLFFEPRSGQGSSVPSASVALESVRRADTGGFALRLSGAVGQQFVVETSTDLIDWNGASTNTLSSPVIDLIDFDPAGEKQFYRLMPFPE